MQTDIRSDAEPFLWKDERWWGVYHDLRGSRPKPPLVVLSNKLKTPITELARLMAEKKPQVRRRLNMAASQDYSVLYLAGRWMEERVQIKNVESTQHAYLSSVLYLVESNGRDFDIREWGSKKEAQFNRFLKNKGIKPRTHQTHLRAFLRWVFNRAELDENLPWFKIEIDRRDVHEIDILTDRELEFYQSKIFKEDKRFQRAFMLGYHCAMRADEIWSMPNYNIDLIEREIKIKTVPEAQLKTIQGTWKKEWKPKQFIHRTLEINDTLYDFLNDDELYERTWFLQGGPRCNNPSGQLYSNPNRLSQAFGKLRKKWRWNKKVEMLRVLRKTAITKMCEHAKLDDVQSFAGHQSPETTQLYYNAVKKRESKKVSRFLG